MKKIAIAALLTLMTLHTTIHAEETLNGAGANSGRLIVQG